MTLLSKRNGILLPERSGGLGNRREVVNYTCKLESLLVCWIVVSHSQAATMGASPIALIPAALARADLWAVGDRRPPRQVRGDPR